MVATVTHITSASATVAYFEQDGYYAKGSAQHRRASAWYGRGAAALGLPRHVSPRRFHAVLSGYVPGTALRLGRIRDGVHEHRPGVDITFSAPKSVSIAALVGGDRGVKRAHDEAVREAMDFVEAELLQTRGYDPATGRRPRVKAHAAVAALFRHDTSRRLDPQLHTHAVVANLCRNAQAQWSSVEPTALFRNRRLIGAYYRHALARRLRGLGHAIVPTLVGGVPGFELAGYSRTVLDAFSARRRDILAALAQWGVAYSAAQAQRAALFTRARKEEPSRKALLERWRAQAAALGLAIVAPGKRKRRPRARVPSDPGSALSVLEIVWRAVEHVEERATVFAASEVRAVALGHAPGVHALEDIDAAIARLVRDGHLVQTPRRGADLAFVTERALRAERAIVAWMREGADTREALVEREALEAHLLATRLTEGQRDAVRTIALSRNRLVGVQGSAGAGKTTMLKSVAQCVGARRLLGLAPSTGATRVLERETGIETATLQWFLARYGDLADARRLAEARREFCGAIVLVDETSMVSTVQMQTLMGIAERLGLERLVLVGDTRQLRAVEAGEPFRLLQAQGMELAVMDGILRQRDADLLEVVRHAQAGRAGAAIEGLGDEVREVAPEALGENAARLWLALEPSRRSHTAILAPTHALRAQIHAIIRERLVGEGILHGPELEIERLIDRRMTRVQTADIANYNAGDAVVFHRDAYGCRSGDICAVAGTSEGRVILIDAQGRSRALRPSGNASRNLAVCDTALIGIRAGDRIRWTRNRAKPRGAGRVRAPHLVNGEEATILAIDSRRVHLRTEQGDTTSLLRTDPQLRHIDHAYSMTVHGAQGRTCRSAIGVLDSGHGSLTTQSTFYVEVSRASEQFVLFTDNAEQLVETLETHTGVTRGALEAIGESTGRAAGSQEGTDAVRALERGWNSLMETAKRRRTVPSRVRGYEETVRRAEELAEGPDLPQQWHRFLADLSAHQRADIGRERRIRALLGRVDAHCRAWPALHREALARGCAPTELPAHVAWRAEGDALHAGAGTLLAERQGALHAEAMAHAGEGAIAKAVQALAAVRVRDEYERLRHRGADIEGRAVHPDYRQWCGSVEALAAAAELPADLRGPVREHALRARALHPARSADGGQARSSAVRRAPESAPQVVVRAPRPTPESPARAPMVPSNGLPRSPTAPGVEVSAQEPRPAAESTVQAPRPRSAAPAMASPVPTSELSIPAAAPSVVVDAPAPRPAVLLQAALVPADELPGPEAASPVVPPTGVVHQLTRPEAAPPVKVDPPRPRASVPLAAPPMPAHALPGPEPESRTPVAAPRPRPAAPAMAPPVPTSELSIPAAAPSVVVDAPAPRPAVLLQAALVPAGNLPRPQADPPMQVRVPRPEHAHRPEAAPPVKVDPPRPRASVSVAAPPVPAHALPGPQPASRTPVAAPRPRPAAPAMAPPVPASELSIPAAAPSVVVDAPAPRPAVLLQAALVPAGSLPKPQADPPVAVRAPRPEHAHRPEAAPPVKVDPPRPRASVSVAAPPVPAHALPRPEPESRTPVAAPRPRPAAPAMAPPVPASELSIPAAAPSVVVDALAPRPDDLLQAALVPAGSLPKPQADRPVAVRAPRREYAHRPEAAPPVKVDPPRPRASVSVAAPPVPAQALPRPEPASRTPVQAPRPRPAAPAMAPPVPTSELSIPAAAPSVVVDAPAPRSDDLLQAALVPAGNLPKPQADPPVAVRAPKPEHAHRPEAAPPVKVDPPRPRASVPVTALPVSVRELPTPRPAGRIRVKEPRHRSAAPTHTTSASAHSLQAPSQVPSHPARPPRDQDTEAADAAERLAAERHAELERRKQRLTADTEAEWTKTARGVLSRDVPKIAQALAERRLKRGGDVLAYDLYYPQRSQFDNACRCDQSAAAAAEVLDSALRAIAQKRYGGRHPPAVRDSWWRRAVDEIRRDEAIAAAMADWKSVSAETIERMVEAGIPGDVHHLRERLGGQQRLDAEIRALSASPQPQHERGRDRGPGYGY